jgi:hypothetical protein
LNTDYVIEHNLAPKELIRTGKLFSKNFAEILVGKDIKGNPVAAFERTFALTYLNLNQKKCQALLLTEFPPEFGLSGISVLNDKLYEFSYGSQLSLPVSEKNAKLCCKNKNTVMLVFE